MPGKPSGWDTALDDAINSGKNYEETNGALKEAFGEEGTVSGSAFRSHKSKLTGGDEVDEKLYDLGERMRPKEKAKKVAKPVWTKKKQTEADASLLANIVNMAIFQGLVPACKNKQLTEKDITDINPGGAVIACVTYYFPGSKLEHPLIMLGIRVVILYLRFQAVCGKIKEAGKEVSHLGREGGSKDGLKPGIKTDVRS